MIRKWIWLSFLYLLIVGVLGCLLRWQFFAPVEGLNYKYFLHAHSHLAFLGWIFNALFAAMIFAYVPKKVKTYKLLFWLLQVAVLGMLVTFPIQGYAAASISFSTLHIFLSYWFAGKFLRDTSAKKMGSRPFSLKFFRWALFFMVISSLGPFALGVIMAQGLSGTNLYQLAIYFYLHFQYDGWFTFAVFGLFFWLLEVNHVKYSHRFAKVFLWLLAIACIPAYALSALWTQPAAWVYVLGFLAAVLQVIAIGYFLSMLKKCKTQLYPFVNEWVIKLFAFALTMFSIKIILQFASAIPWVADLAYKVRNFTIGYLHIVFLGFVSVFLIGWLGHVKLVSINQGRAKTGIIFFITGFVLSEFMIFLQPTLLMLNIGGIPFYFQSLFAVSLLMPGGILLLLIPHKQKDLFTGTATT